MTDESEASDGPQEDLRSASNFFGRGQNVKMRA